MRSHHVVVLAAAAMAALSFASSEARAQDGGPCILDGGTIDGTGKCDNQDAVFCGTDSTLQRLHCPALPITPTLTLQNGLCDDTTSFGAWCTFPETTTCAFVDAQDNPLNFMCGTPTDDPVNLVCDIDDGCTTVNAGGFFGATCAATTAKCIGQHLRTDCTPWSQAVTLDCTKHAGNCVDNGGGNATCVNGLNGDCDQNGTLFTCASGLTCVGATATTFGKCHDPNQPVDAGTPPPHDAGQTAQDAGQVEHDAGQAEHDAGQAAHDAGQVVEHDAGTVHTGEGEGEGGGGGITLGSTPDAGDVNTEPLQSGCGCSSSPTGSALFVASAIALGLVARRRRPR